MTLREILRQVHYAILVVTAGAGWRRPFLIVIWWAICLPRALTLPWRNFWWDDEGNTNYPGS